MSKLQSPGIRELGLDPGGGETVRAQPALCKMTMGHESGYRA